MKKLLLAVMLLLMAALFNPFDMVGWLVNDAAKLSNKKDFEKMINEKHYLIKSLALNPNKMNKDTYHMLYTIFNADWIAKKKMIEFATNAPKHNNKSNNSESPEKYFSSLK